jgi:hypothetical protein
MENITKRKSLIFTLVMFLTASWSLCFAETVLSEQRTDLKGQTITIVKTNPTLSDRVKVKDFFGSRDEFELFWDDGGPEGTFPGIMYPNGLYTGVKFVSPLPCFRLQKVKLYSTGYPADMVWQRLIICPDYEGQPDTTRPYKVRWWVHKIIYPDIWTEYSMNTTMFDDTFWVLFQWPPYYLYNLASDSTASDSMTYCADWQRYPFMNHQYTDIDAMIRVVGDSIGVNHDATAISIIEPFYKWIYPYGTRVLVGDTIIPKAQVGNCGVGSENFNVIYLITDSLGGVVYSDTKPVTLNANQTDTVIFDNWVPADEGDLNVVVYTNLGGDEYPANDTIELDVTSSRETIIFYDTGITGSFECTIPDWATNRKHLVKFTPTLTPPFLIKGCRILLYNSTPLEYVSVCFDDNGLPDTTAPLATVYDVSGTIPSPKAGLWAEVDFGEIERTDTTPLWVIAKYYEGYSQPKMGTDQGRPLGGHSWRYYFKDGTGHWDDFTDYKDWIMHLVLKKAPTGVEEVIIGNQEHFSLSFASNPVINRSTILYNLPVSSDVSLGIYNVFGQLVKTLIDKNQEAGLHTVIWDGSDSANREIPAGVYFCRLETDAFSQTRKLVLLK